MTKKSILFRHFDELAHQLDVLASTKKYHQGELVPGDYIDQPLFIKWKIKARNLLSNSCGESSSHFQDFVKLENGKSWRTNHDTMILLKAVFEAAREDFEGGYCKTLRTLIQSEVFDSELEQARELFNAGYLPAAAVIAGVVLETTLRQLCDNHQIAHSKLEKMNADLVKVGQYTLLKQKQVTAWADIRNNAAHGHVDKFNRNDVDDMIAKVEIFVSEYL